MQLSNDSLVGQMGSDQKRKRCESIKENPSDIDSMVMDDDDSIPKNLLKAGPGHQARLDQ